MTQVYLVKNHMSSNTTKQTLSRRNHGNNTKETHEKKFFRTGGQKKLKFRCSNYTEKFGVKFFGGLKIAVVFFSKLAEKCTTFSTLLLPIDNFLHKKVFFRSSPGVELQGNYVGMFDLHVYWYTITMAGLFLVVQTRTHW